MTRSISIRRWIRIIAEESLIPQPLPDTVYLKDVSIEYRYKMIHDTVKVVQRDSIPYEVTVTVKEITRPLTPLDKLCRTCFFFLSGVLFALLLRFLLNLKSKLRI